MKQHKNPCVILLTHISHNARSRWMPLIVCLSRRPLRRKSVKLSLLTAILMTTLTRGFSLMDATDRPSGCTWS